MPSWFWRAVVQSILTAVLVVGGYAAYNGWQQHQAEQRHQACIKRNDQNRMVNAMQGNPDGAFQPEDCGP